MLLKLNWSDIVYSQKVDFFNNDEAAFLQKKQLLIVNARITDKMKTLHAKIKIETNLEQRIKLAKEIVILENERSKNWQLIDEK